METTANYQLGLMYLVHLVITADKVVDEDELRALAKIKKLESVSSDLYENFLDEVQGKSEREIFEAGIDIISDCTTENQKRAFAWLLKISESDGHVHVKEIRFLLYSLKKAGLDFNDVVALSKTLPSLES